jgi:phage terminase large subunit
MFITFYDLKNLNGYTPTETQKKGHLCKAKYLLFGGACAGGKTTFGTQEAILHALRWPGAVIAIGRLEKTSLLRTTAETLKHWLPASEVARQNKEGVTFKNGSRIIYLGLSDDKKNLDRIRGLEISMCFVDDAGEVSFTVWGLLLSRLRLALPGVEYKAIVTANPSPSWLRTEFLQDPPKKDHAFIQSLPSSNSHLPEGYLDDLKANMPDHLWQIYFNGEGWQEWASENDMFPDDLIRAAVERRVERVGPVSWGIDVARKGSCSTVLARKTGNLYELMAELPGGTDFMDQALRITDIIRDRRAFGHVDCAGVGGGLLDFLHAAGFLNLREHVGSTGPTNPRYKSRRAEVVWDFRSTLYTCQIPNDKALLAQLHMKYDLIGGRLMVESKESLARRLANTDKLDALVLASIGSDKNVTYEKPKPTPDWQKSDREVLREMEHEFKFNRIVRR